ncbi:MAG: ATP-binding cassette domain-containing protein [Candidatus Nanopelagicales bacterium]
MPDDLKALVNALADVPHEAGVAKPDPILIADGVKRHFGGLVAVDVSHVEIQRGTITALIGPNGAGKTTFFNLLTGFDRPNEGKWTFEGRQLAGVRPHKVAQFGMVRTFQLTKALSRLTVMENMRLGAQHQRGEKLFASFLPFLWRAQEDEISERALRLLESFNLAAKQDDLAGLAVGWSAQTAGDGPGADGRAGHGHAGRADGRREPGFDAEPARPHPSGAGQRDHRPVRRARHGHGARHQRLGDRDEPGQSDRRRSAA